MPAKSRAQQRLMQAAEHGADFPVAKKVRASLSHQQLHDFAAGSEKGKPQHVTEHHRTVKQTGGHPHRMGGSHDGLYVSEHHRK